MAVGALAWQSCSSEIVADMSGCRPFKFNQKWIQNAPVCCGTVMAKNNFFLSPLNVRNTTLPYLPHPCPVLSCITIPGPDNTDSKRVIDSKPKRIFAMTYIVKIKPRSHPSHCTTESYCSRHRPGHHVVSALDLWSEARELDVERMV